MLYSRTTKYAILALAEFASRGTERPIPTREVAQATEIPYAFLAKIVSILRKSGILTPARGRRGGVRLSRPAADIRIVEVVRAIEGDEALEDCPVNLKRCDCTMECALHSVWRTTHDAVVAFLEHTTIEDVARARAALRAGGD